MEAKYSPTAEDFFYETFCRKQERESLESLAKYGSYQASEWERVKKEELKANGTDVALNDSDIFGDGDQSLVENHEKQQHLRDIWSAGGDVEFNFIQGNLPSFAVAVMTGDVKAVQRMLAECDTTDDKTRLLELRHSVLRLPALILAMVGHRIVSSPIPGDPVGVVMSLLENGARWDARDLLGKTIIDYAVGALCEEGSTIPLDIADLCIARSKEVASSRPLVDFQDRFGDTPLMMAVMMNRVDLVTYLTKKHADSTICNLDGISSLQIAPHASTVRSILLDGLRKVKKNKCVVCKKSEKTFLCARCNAASYCSRDCQKNHWKEHKQTCGVIKFDIPILPVKTGLMAADLNGERTALWKGALPKGIKPGEVFEVRIQVGPSPRTPFEINDESRGLFTQVTPDACKDFMKLYELVHSFTSCAGRKAYFKAKMDAPGCLVVSSSEMFVRKW